MINILSNSGASTNLEAIAGASIGVLERGFKPDLIDGNSSGALIAPLLSMGRLEDLKYFALNYGPESAFSISPINSKGSPTLRGLFRVLKGKGSLGEMKCLYRTLMEAFTPQDWKLWRSSSNMPDIVVATVGYNSGKLFKTNLKAIDDYEKVIKYIIASASIPLMVEGVEIDGEIHYDGGWRTHTLAPHTQQTYKQYGIKRHISIYSRPKNYLIKRDDESPNFLNVLTRSFEIMNTEISKANELDEMAFRIDNNLSLNDMIFMPHLLKKKTYEFGNNKEKFLIGYKAVQNVEF